MRHKNNAADNAALYATKGVTDMKKTIRTAMTAAIFAAANMSAMPSMAAGDSENNQWPAFNSGAADISESVEFTGQNAYGVYGPPPTDGTWWDGEPWADPDYVERLATTVTTTMMPAPVYGPAPTTTVTDDDWHSVLTTFTTTMATTSTTEIVTTMPEPVYGPPIYFFLGDANADGRVDSFDAIALRRMLVTGQGSMDERYYGDINQDGKVSISDLLLLQRYLLGKIKDLKEYNSGYYFDRDTDIEKITTTVADEPVITTETEPYDPGKDIIVTLYGIRPSDDILKDITKYKYNTDDQEK